MTTCHGQHLGKLSDQSASGLIFPPKASWVCQQMQLKSMHQRLRYSKSQWHSSGLIHIICIGRMLFLVSYNFHLLGLVNPVNNFYFYRSLGLILTLIDRTMTTPSRLKDFSAESDFSTASACWLHIL